MDYSGAGVDRDGRSRAKSHFSRLKETYSLSRHGKIIETPFNSLYPVGNDVYHVKTADGVGTKVLVAQMADKHDTIGIDAVAMVANDCIRCGAQPLALTNIIDTRKTDERLVSELQKGLNEGAKMAGCPMVGGELADVSELLSAAYQINCDCVGEVQKEKIISGCAEEGDAVIGLRSSGLHANGFTLARKVLFREWGGRFDAFEILDGMDKELVLEALTPTEIYVKGIMAVAKDFSIRAAVNITGDAYLKFRKVLSSGFEFSNFRPHEIFSAIQREGNIETKEMFSTFNMGWGFALVVKKEDADDVLGRLKQAEVIGRVTNSKSIAIRFKNENIIL